MITSAPDTVEFGSTYPHYGTAKLIGSGGMGAVYAAYDSRLQRDVAIKMLPSAQSSTITPQSALHEARVASALNHPNICAVYDIGSHDHCPFIVMEFVSGRTLSAVTGGHALDVATTVQYATQIADALAHAHRRNIAHRDLKSANVMVTPEGRIKLLDFGIAKRLSDVVDGSTESPTTEHSTTIGTLAYMPPEALRGEHVGLQGDVWSFGVLLYELLSGVLPFQGPTAHVVAARILAADYSPIRGLDDDAMSSLVSRCLQLHPAARPSSGVELLTHIEALRHVGVRPTHRSLAVLPFENLAADAAADYFADGMTEALIRDLAKISALRVIARSSVMRYKRSSLPLGDIARELGVDSLIEGSILHAGDRVRISVGLVDAQSQHTRWSATHDGDLGDILAFQTQVARAVAGEIRVILTPQEGNRLRAEAVDPLWHDRFLQAVALMNRRDGASLKHAAALLEQLLAGAGRHAEAHAALADCYTLLGAAAYADSESDCDTRARQHAIRAVELDPLLSQGHGALGLVKFRFDWDWLGAELHLRRALELSPSDSSSHHRFALLLAAMGRHLESLSEIAEAQRLDPKSPVMATAHGRLLHWARRFDEAVAQCERTLEAHPQFAQARFDLAMSLGAIGQHERARREMERAMATGAERRLMIAVLGRICADAGDRDSARQALDRLQAPGAHGAASPYFSALILVGLGEVDQAMAMLELAHRERFAMLAYLKVEPYFDALRDHPRFGALLRRMALN